MRASAQPVIEWQRDLSQSVFLANAVELLGKHIYGQEWLGREQRIQIPMRLPHFRESLSPQGRRTRLEAHKILDEIDSYISCPVLTKLPPSIGALTPSSFHASDYHFSEKSWETAVKIREDEIAELVSCGERVASVRSKLVEAFIAGRIKTGLRPHSSYTVEAIPSDMWSVVNLSNVFNSYQIDQAKPVSIYFCGDTFQWVYVDKADLESYLCTVPHEGVTRSHKSADNQKLSEEQIKALLETEYQNRKTFNQKDAREYIQSIDPQANRDTICDVLQGVTGKRGRGRPSKFPRNSQA